MHREALIHLHVFCFLELTSPVVQGHISHLLLIWRSSLVLLFCLFLIIIVIVIIFVLSSIDGTSLSLLLTFSSTTTDAC